MISSGVTVISRVLPSCPGWPPTFLPDFSRKLFVRLGRFSSLDGGMELLRLFFRVRSLANCCSTTSNRSFNSLFSSISNAMICFWPSMMSCSGVCTIRFYTNIHCHPIISKNATACLSTFKIINVSVYKISKSQIIFKNKPVHYN